MAGPAGSESPEMDQGMQLLAAFNQGNIQLSNEPDADTQGEDVDPGVGSNPFGTTNVTTRSKAKAKAKRPATEPAGPKGPSKRAKANPPRATKVNPPRAAKAKGKARLPAMSRASQASSLNDSEQGGTATARPARKRRAVTQDTDDGETFNELGETARQEKNRKRRARDAKNRIDKKLKLAENPGPNPDRPLCHFCADHPQGQIANAARRCDWVQYGNVNVQCRNCADYRSQNPNVEEEPCKVGELIMDHKRYGCDDPDAPSVKACTSCVAGNRQNTCDVDPLLGYRCSNCATAACRVPGSGPLKARPRMVGERLWFRHACDRCASGAKIIADRDQCNWLRSRLACIAGCARCLTKKSACIAGSEDIVYAPTNAPPPAKTWWTQMDSPSGYEHGTIKLQWATRWRHMCQACADFRGQNQCVVSASHPYTSCLRCNQLGIDCIETGNNGRRFPMLDLSKVGVGKWLPFQGCKRCNEMGRNCDRQRPCDSCVNVGEGRLCDEFKKGDYAAVHGCCTRFPEQPSLLYYLGLGYGAAGVDTVKDGSGLEDWIGPLTAKYSTLSAREYANLIASEVLAKFNQLRPAGVPPHGGPGGSLQQIMPSEIDKEKLVSLIHNAWPQSYPPKDHHDFQARLQAESDANWPRVREGFGAPMNDPADAPDIVGQDPAAAPARNPNPQPARNAYFPPGNPASQPQVPPGNIAVPYGMPMGPPNAPARPPFPRPNVATPYGVPLGAPVAGRSRFLEELLARVGQVVQEAARIVPNVRSELVLGPHFDANTPAAGGNVQTAGAFARPAAQQAVQRAIQPGQQTIQLDQRAVRPGQQAVRPSQQSVQGGVAGMQDQYRNLPGQAAPSQASPEQANPSNSDEMDLDLNAMDDFLMNYEDQDPGIRAQENLLLPAVGAPADAGQDAGDAPAGDAPAGNMAQNQAQPEDADAANLFAKINPFLITPADGYPQMLARTRPSRWHQANNLENLDMSHWRQSEEDDNVVIPWRLLGVANNIMLADSPARDILRDIPLRPREDTVQDEGFTRCMEPGAFGFGVCGNDALDRVGCQSKTHRNFIPYNFLICEQCNDESTQVVVNATYNPITAAEIMSMRAYACDTCAKHLSENEDAETLQKAGAKNVWGKVSPGSQLPNRIQGDGDHAGVRYQATTMSTTGCACATKLLGRPLCRFHRLHYAELAMKQAALMQDWRLCRFGKPVCPVCLMNEGYLQNVKVSADHDDFLGTNGGPTAWACLVCTDWVVNQRNDINNVPQLVPGHLNGAFTGGMEGN
ncbi:hypothetical protein QQZ08_010575 [Neonectria magnoliae]|uniref:Zn(2)-C6 fungal-type domain-containing protein n=1 Tax=Neonectria magnoliae TaxID=2732573 RepID=A0ABR1HGS2_9HYPO